MGDFHFKRGVYTGTGGAPIYHGVTAAGDTCCRSDQLERLCPNCRAAVEGREPAAASDPYGNPPDPYAIAVLRREFEAQQIALAQAVGRRAGLSEERVERIGTAADGDVLAQLREAVAAQLRQAIDDPYGNPPDPYAIAVLRREFEAQQRRKR